MLVLQILQGPDRGRRIELPDHEPQQIGRSSEAIHLGDQTISRRHAELTPEGDGQWSIRDLQSSNGTFVNGVRVSDSRKLKPGDQIRCGNSLLVFGEGAPSNPLARQLRMARRGELEVNVEASVASNDDSMIMSSPDPSQAAEFQLGVIYRLLRLVGSVTTKQEMFERVMDVVFEYFSPDRAFILTQEDPSGDGAVMEPVVIRRRPPSAGAGASPATLAAAHPDAALPVQPEAPVTISHTIVQYVARKRVGVLTSNAMNDTRFTTGDSVRAYGIRSAICVPIRYKDFFYGVIHIDSTVANYTYTEDQLHLLTAIGVQTGLALANIRLVEARLRAERLAAVGSTVASLSHSIKNILQGMRGGADVVELGLRKQNLQVVGNGWTIVARNLERIYELTLNMLQFSKQRKPELEMIQIIPVLEDVVALEQKQYDAKGVALLTDFYPDLPPVPVQASGIHQAVLNLVSNALDASASGDVVTLACRVVEEDDELELRVVDRGVGIGPAIRQRLFEPFHSTKGYGGTGLGLVVTKKVIDEHGGRVWVESEPGQGATFFIRLPLSPGAAPESAETHGPSVAKPRDDREDELTVELPELAD
ncbi:MAG: ATP-binding protein [Planctomycetota bacterium]